MDVLSQTLYSLGFSQGSALTCEIWKELEEEYIN